MNLEQQVCSLELAKKLKELGVRQESLFWWYQVVGTIKAETEADWQIKFGQYDTGFSAFTVAELGELMMMFDEEDIIKAYGSVFNVPETKIITPTGLKKLIFNVDLVARLLIYLIENSLIKI